MPLALPASAQQGAHAQASGAVDAPPGFRDACRRYPWLCRGSAGRAMTDEQLRALARQVNARVNRSVRQVDDQVHHGVPEFWSLPDAGGGDCEDLVLLKKKMLLDAGVAADRLSVAVVLDRAGENHTVLLVSLAAGDIVLDSLTGSVSPWSRTGYTFLARQLAGDKSRWGALASGRAGSVARR